MTNISFSLSLLVLVVIVILHQLFSNYRWNKKYKLPPRVPGWPIVGNALDMPFPGGMWGVEMAKKYGEMFTVTLGGRNMVFLNSPRVVEDLLEKRAGIYSSRPWRPLGSDIMSGSNRGVLLPYGDRWRNQRKIQHSILNGRLAESKFVPYQNLESKQLLYEYLTNPSKFYEANQRFSNSVMTSVVYGRRAKDHDPGLKQMLRNVEIMAEVLFDPLKGAVDSYYWLKYLPKPLQWWRKMGEKYYNDSLVLYQAEYDSLIKKMENGTARPCFAVDVTQSGDKKEYQIGDEERLIVLAALLEAGSDTSRIMMTQLVAAMALYPAWVKKARAMLDEVCGTNAERLPTLDDRSKIPYITADVKEGLRWRPFIQTGVPHMLMQDDEYEGYRFPAGTQFTWNAYAIALNKDHYEDPMNFLPERFMNDDLSNPLKGHWAFGAGRRVCVGYNVGANNGWIFTACMLYCFDVKEDPNYPIDTLNTHWDVPDKAPFKAIITPRSQAHADLIRRCAPEALDADY